MARKKIHRDGVKWLYKKLEREIKSHQHLVKDYIKPNVLKKFRNKDTENKDVQEAQPS